MKNCYGLILAAGEGKRMKSKLPKVLHKVCGKAMLSHVTQALQASGLCPEDYIVVIGHGGEEVKKHLGDNIKTVYQDKQLGTGHAVMCCEEFLKRKSGTVIILAGDVPLINSTTISNMMEFHSKNNYAVTVMTAEVDVPDGFGRIIRSAGGDIEKIVEHKDCTDDERNIKEVNSGTYCFDIEKLLGVLRRINNDNAQGEYYLPDAIELLKDSSERVGAYKTSYYELMELDSRDIGFRKEGLPSISMGVNSRVQLNEANELMRKKINFMHMLSGVTIIDSASTYIDADVRIGQDTVIYPGAIIEGNTNIGENCVIGPGTRLVNCTVETGADIQSSVVYDSKIGSEAHVGPFAYIRPESVIGANVKIGDFVEIKKSTIGDGTKVSHLTYIGDAEIGKSCNFGCGTVVVNYDGTKKHKTIVGDNSFVGCNTNLVAPVKIGDNAYIAAGSTITWEVPDGALAIARARQVNKEGWVEKKGIWKK